MHNKYHFQYGIPTHVVSCAFGLLFVRAIKDTKTSLMLLDVDLLPEIRDRVESLILNPLAEKNKEKNRQKNSRYFGVWLTD